MTLATNTPAQIEFTRVNNDVNGNPRYVCHFLNFVSEADNNEAKKLSTNKFSYLDGKYTLALMRAKKIGGRKFNNKQYGGGIVFQSYNIADTERLILELVTTGK